MQSKQSLHLKNLEKKLKKLLKSYSSIYDFIIFGSFIKNKMNPADMDIALITETKEPRIIGEIKGEIDKVLQNAHLQIIHYKDFLTSKMPYYLLSEGYSVRKGSFIFKKLNVLRKVLYTFELKDLQQTEKVMFNKALKSLIKKTNSEKIGKGAILVPISSSGEFEDFLEQWKRKIIKKEFLEI